MYRRKKNQSAHPRLNSAAKRRAAACGALPPAAAIESLEPRCLLSATLLTSVSTALSADPISVVNVNGTAYCASSDNGTPAANYLWKSDGTAAGTSLVETFRGYNVGPTEMTASGGKLFFTAAGYYGSGQDAATRELFVSDGTSAGTFALTNFRWSATPETDLTDVNGTLFFMVKPDSSNAQLWKTDGTVAGTVQVTNWPLQTEILPGTLQNVNGTLYFVGTDPVHGDELWKSDGTAAGTGIVDDINPGTHSGFNGDLTYVNGTIFFAADDGSHGIEFWKTDGTAAGTMMVKDIEPIGAIGSNLQDLTAFKGELYFSASDDTHGDELWKSDGSTAGTVMVADINPGSGDSYPNWLTVIGNSLYFSADDGTHGDELWKTDGSNAGTVMVSDINPGLSSGGDGGSSNPELLTNAGGTLYFTADDGAHGMQLWTSDGTTAGTQRLTNIPDNIGNFAYMLPLGSHLLFLGNDGTHGAEMWGSDGTAAGTGLLRDIWPGYNSSEPHSFANIGGKVLFAATDTTQGMQLWGTDGTSAGTSLVKVLTMSINGLIPKGLSAVGGRVVFAGGNAGPGLWSSDGTVSGTQLFAPSLHFDDMPQLVSSQGELYFDSGGSLWKTDGTSAGTVSIASFTAPPSETPVITDLTDVNGRLYFSASDATIGQELWSSDGTAAGTYLVVDVTPGISSSSTQFITGVNGQVFFDANGMLYKTDGSVGGTIPLTGPYFITEGLGPNEQVALNNDLLFTGNPSSGYPRLWRSDGTPAGTAQVDPAANLRPVSTFAVLNGSAYFMNLDSSGNESLYKTDGTDAGTSLVLDFGKSTFGESLLTINGTLYFVGPDANSLWKSDGTTAGTVQVAALPPGPRGVENLINADGTLYFLDNSRVFTSDGTAAGTVEVDNSPDQATGAFDLVAVGDQAFFSADSANYGNQLWVITPPAPPPAPAAPSGLTATAISGGEVDLSWSSVPGALAIQIQRSSDPSFSTIDKNITIQSPDATAYVDTTVTLGSAYYYRLSASNRGGQSPFAMAGAITPAAPAAPSGLTTATFPSHVDLSWTDNSTNETGFRIERSATPDFEHIDAVFTVPANVSTFSDTSVSWANSYCYRVTAYNAAGASGALTTRVFTPELPASSLIATRVSPTEVDLQWVTNSVGQYAFRILRSVAGGTPVYYDLAGSTENNYNDISASANISYTYIVEQYGAYGASDSNAATSLTVAPQFMTAIKALPDVSLPGSSSNPSQIVMSGGIGFFSATDQTVAMGLWRTDGTAAGTFLVKDVGQPSNASQLTNLTDVNGTLYFVAADPNVQLGIALWKSNGTSAGTVMVRDLSPSALESNIHDLTNFNGTLYFRGGGQESGAKSDALWKTDGTAAGTVLVKDFPLGDGYPYENQMVDVNGKLFLAAGATTGNALYVSDGTAAGTVQVLPNAAAMSITNLTQVGNGIYFVDSVTDRLWYSDGTAAGTFQVPGSPQMPYSTFGPGSDQFTDVSGKLFFIGFGGNGVQVWTSDGTAAGTHSVADLPQSANGIFPPLANLNGKCALVVSDNYSSTSVEVSDGTAGGATVIGSYTSDVGSSNVTSLITFNAALYYAAEQVGQGWTLFKSNGSAGSAVPLATFDQRPTNFSIVNGLLTFTGDVNYSGAEPWRTDGTPAGTYMITNIGSDTWTAQPDWLTNINGTVFFASTSSIHTGPFSAIEYASDVPVQLWKTDGTATGTTLLADVAPSHLVAVGNTLYFSGLTQATGTELWKSDGTAAGTVLVKDIVPGGASSDAIPLANLNGVLIFRVPSSTPGEYQLWRSDGTDAGTYSFSTVLMHAYSSNGDATAPYFAVSGGVFYFVSGSGGDGYELWRSDGTSAGTVQVSDIVPGTASSDPSDLTDVNGTLYFAANTMQSLVRDLYKSDGTAAGTVPVAVVGQAVQWITNVNGAVFFAGTDATHGTELWKTDGAGGAGIVRDLVPGRNSAYPYQLTAVGNTLYFVAEYSNGLSYALYKSDGTSAGTVPVRQFQSFNTSPVYLTNANGVLFYSDGYHLWSSDGTLAGTQNVANVSDPASETSVTCAGAPDVVLGKILLFSAYIPGGGRELRTVAATPPLPPVSLAATAPGGTGGSPAAAAGAIPPTIRFSATTSTATLTWQNPANNNAAGLIIDRSKDPNFASNLISTFVSAATIRFTDASLIPGTRYYYRVRAINGAGITASSTVWLTVPTALATLSANWGSASAALYTAADGLHLLPAGRKTDVPWSGVASFSITLANAAVLAAGDVTISSAAGINYGPVTITGSGMSYRIILAHPITSADRITITLSNAAVTLFKRELDVLPGDINDDGKVNFADFVILSNHFGQTYAPPAWSEGDMTGDNKVTFADFVVFSNNFGKTLPPLPPAAPLVLSATKPAAVRKPFLRIKPGIRGR
ncbi:MAG TPA: ELWxxDGT repeat protein [Tepidisphaeraceae bacterium]|nr:ELWxxDGT repeat protein [Tepidisphaeraceae bacterium]